MAALARLVPKRPTRSAASITFPYYARKALFSPAERAFLGVLDEAAAGRFRVFAKVRLADVIGVKRGTAQDERQRALNRLLAKHVDYVLCRPNDLSIVALVELDDRSHERPSRQTRDHFLEKACAAAGVPLLRFAAQPTYALSDVRAQLANLDPAARPANAQDATAMPVGRPGARS